MARRVGRRKMPNRDEFQMKNVEKVEGGIFDRNAMIYLSKFFNSGLISKIEFPIARGKEADVYLADPGISDVIKGAAFVVLKFFRVETSSFNSMTDYIVGDERFSHIRGSKRFIINTWCKKEYGNLKIAEAAGVPVPKPYMSNGSILAMEFIGSSDGRAAPMLRDIELDDPRSAFNTIILYIKELYNARLVHADLSEYNILVNNGKFYLIDFGQAVIIKHPKAVDFLYRDIDNIVRYFNKRYQINVKFEDAKKEVTG